MNQETLYLACLLECGNIPQLNEVIRYHRGEPISWKTRNARSVFMAHKDRVEDWAFHHNVPSLRGQVHPKSRGLWVLGFYDWLSKQGEGYGS